MHREATLIDLLLFFTARCSVRIHQSTPPSFASFSAPLLHREVTLIDLLLLLTARPSVSIHQTTPPPFASFSATLMRKEITLIDLLLLLTQDLQEVFIKVLVHPLHRFQLNSCIGK